MLPNTPTFQHAVLFEHAAGARLAAAERFITVWPALFGSTLVQGRLAVSAKNRVLLALATFDAKAAGPEVDARFAFWAGQTGGVPLDLRALDARALAALTAQLQRCEHGFNDIPPRELRSRVGELMSALGVNREASGPLRVLLSLSRAEAVTRYEPQSGRILVRAQRQPPIGDVVPVTLTLPGRDAPVELKAKVATATSAGYALEPVDAPPELRKTLEALAAEPVRPASRAAERRASPRIAVRAPVKVSAPAEVLRLSYSDAGAFVSDYVDNLSVGGAFVRTGKRVPTHTAVTLELEAPDGRVFRAPGTVVNVMPTGMGVQFKLGAEDRATLEELIAALSRPPRRALVVDDDLLLRTMMADALHARGFSVLTASSGRAGLLTLMEELLSLEVLVTDLAMPELDGESLVKTIRGEGAENDLVIVVLSGRAGGADAERLRGLGVDMVLDKAQGPAHAAEQIELAVQRRREQAAPEQQPKQGVDRGDALRVVYRTHAELAAAAAELAAAGVFVHTHRRFEHGDTVAVELELPGTEVCPAQGSVVGVEQAGVALELTFPPDVRARLNEALAQSALFSDDWSDALLKSAVRLLDEGGGEK